MRKLTLPLLLSIFVASQPVNADVISQSIEINTGSGFDQLHLLPFDPSLGELERVDVSIHAQAFFSGLVTTLTPWYVIVELDMFGLAGNFFDFAGSGLTLFDSGFETDCVPTQGSCIPIPTLVTSVGVFDLSFYFTDFAEEIGVNQAFLTSFSSTLPGSFPPASINGAVSDFLPIPAMIEELDLVTRIGTRLNYSWNGTMIVGGNMQIDYEYAKRTPVPEPGTLALFAIGLLALLIGRRRTVSGTC